MFNQEGQIKLHLGSSSNVTSQITLRGRDHPIYLTNPPYDNNQPLIDNFTLIYFLSTFDDNKYTFTQTRTIKKGKMHSSPHFSYHISFWGLNDFLFIFLLKVVF